MTDSGGHFEVICKRCGQHNEDASAFCGGCGAFLEWEGERVESTAPETEVAPVTVAQAPPEPAPEAPPADTPTPVAAQPSAIKPAMPVYQPPPPRPRVSTRQTNPGDLICGNCGEGNEASRKFCRRCGTTLSEATVAAVVPWWRRLFSRQPKARPVAGTRPASMAPGGRRTPRRPGFGKLLALAVVIIVALFAAVPSLRKHVTNEASSVRRSIHPNYPKVPLQTAAATNVGSCPAPRLNDNSTVYWSTHASGGPVQVLTVTLAAGFKGNLDKVGITPMGPDAPAVGSATALPYPQQLSFGAGGVPLPSLVLANPPTFRSFTVKATRPGTIEISAVSTDPGAPANVCAETAFIFYDRT